MALLKVLSWVVVEGGSSSSQLLLLHHAFLSAAKLPCHGSHGIKHCEAISPKRTLSFMCFLVHGVLAQQKKSN